MWNVQEAGLTDLENQMEQVELASYHLVKTKLDIESVLLKENSKMKVWKIATESKVQILIYH